MIDPDGRHRIVGRETCDLIKRPATRIPARSSRPCSGHLGVAECAVVGEPDPDLGQRIVAYVVPARGAASDDLAED